MESIAGKINPSLSKRSFWHVAEIEQMLALFRDGQTYQKIGDIIGRPKAAVAGYIHRLKQKGIDPRVPSIDRGIFHRKQRPTYTRTRNDITADYIREHFDYCPLTGVFRWKSSRPKIRIGDIAGTQSGRYWMICFSGVDYHAHRLAWLHYYGEWPDGLPDHRNGDGLDNRIENLRDATRSQNGANMRISSRNTSGFKGVSFSKLAGRWEAYIKVQGQRRHLGLFAAPELAAAAYDVAAIEAFGEFALTNSELARRAA